MAKELYSTNFYPSVKRTKVAGKSNRISEYGYVADGEKLPVEYLATITSFRLRSTVVAPIQDNISTRIESRWESFIPTSILNGGNILLQAVTGGKRALISKATSRRIWMGSSPLTMALTLKFEAVKDAFTEVVEPVRLLQEMALPSEPQGNISTSDLGNITTISGAIEALSKLPLLGPPGPSPFTLNDILTAEKQWNDMSTSEIIDGLKGGDIIVVKLGRFMTFWNVIIKTIDPVWRWTPDRSGDPTGAEVTVVFETYEMMTKESLEKAYNTFTFGQPGD